MVFNKTVTNKMISYKVESSSERFNLIRNKLTTKLNVSEDHRSRNMIVYKNNKGMLLITINIPGSQWFGIMHPEPLKSKLLQEWQMIIEGVISD